MFVEDTKKINSSLKIYTVSEITFGIKNLLETNFRFVCIKGEISNFKKQSSGHLYFSLKDSSSQISCALFRGSARFLNNKLPKDGDQVIIYGQLSVYPPRGNYQIIVTKLEFLGVGELLLKLHELKEFLKKEGYFDIEKKKPLPSIPKTIGVVTSPTGAVIQDIINVLKRRYKNFHLILNPVKVQGDGAKEEIAQAIEDFNKYNLADVLIVGRGGGSLEDLWPFNEKIVADAIFRSKIPIISAVGHETDTTIADLVADVRAPTPSAAAEIAIKEKKILISTLENYFLQINRTINNLVKYYKNNLNNFLKNPAIASSYLILSKPMQQIDEIKTQIDTSIKYFLEKRKSMNLSYLKQLQALNPKNKITFCKNKLTFYRENIDSTVKNILKFHKNNFNEYDKFNELTHLMKNIVNYKKNNFLRFISHLKSIDPKNLLKKGYSILFRKKDNNVILSSKNVEDNEQIYALMHDGKIKLRVEEKNINE